MLPMRKYTPSSCSLLVCAHGQSMCPSSVEPRFESCILHGLNFTLAVNETDCHTRVFKYDGRAIPI